MNSSWGTTDEEKLNLSRCTCAAILGSTRCNLRLELQSLGLLPAEALVGAEVAILGGLEVDGLGEVELLDNDTGAQVEVGADDRDKLVRVLLGGAVCVDVDGEGLGDTDGVRELDEGTAAEASGDE